MAVLIDTSVLASEERRGDALDEAVGDQERAISAVTASELLQGAHRARDDRTRMRRLAFVEHLIATVDPMPVTLSVARSYAEIRAVLEREDESLGTQQAWIAATALSHGMDLATAEADDFGCVPGLSVIAV